MSISGPNQVTYLRLSDVSRAFIDRVVLDGVSLSVSPGERVALVGENGAGKSTLLRIAAGLDEADRGEVLRPASLVLVHQVLPFSLDATVAEVLAAATAQARRIEDELTEAGLALGATDPEGTEYDRLVRRYDQALSLAELTNVWALDSEVDQVTAGLGLAEVERERPVGAMSGGQRRRLALAAALLAHPVALLLDEPTNHLDEAGLEFLAGRLVEWAGPVLFASHDRVFLDEVATKVVDLDVAMDTYRPGAELQGRQGAVYSGNYSDYLVAKAAAHERWVGQYATEQAELKRLQHEVKVGARQVMHTTVPKGESKIAKKFYSDKAATVISRRVNSAETRLERLAAEQVAKPPPPLRFAGFEGRAPTSSTEVIAELREVAYPGRLAPASLRLSGSDRLLITGVNGVGKSTLLAILAGALTPTSGARLVRRGLRIGLLAQEVQWDDPALPAASAYLAALRHPDRAPSLGALGLLPGRDHGRPVEALSVGQQRRLQLAVLVAEPPNLLLLDEPTNHLALGLSEELETALVDYPGAVVIASHDRWLRSHWKGRILEL